MSQDPQYSATSEPSPIVRQLEAVVGHDTVVAVDGYVGTSDSINVRLYLDLTLGEYVETLQADVLHVAHDERETGRVTMYLRGSASIRTVSTRVVATTAQQLRKKKEDDDGDVTPLGQCLAFVFGTWNDCVADALTKYPGDSAGELILRKHELDACNAALKSDVRRCFGLHKPEGGVIAH